MRMLVRKFCTPVIAKGISGICGHESSLFLPTEVPMTLKLDCLLSVTILYSYKDRLLD